MRWVPSDIPGEHAESESAQRSRPLPSAPADPAQSVSQRGPTPTKQAQQDTMRGDGSVTNICVIFLNQTRKHWCEVSRRSHLSWDEDLRHCERRNFASPRTGRPAGTSGAFVIRWLNFFFVFCGFSDSLLQSRYRRDHLVRIAQASPVRGWNNS